MQKKKLEENIFCINKTIELTSISGGYRNALKSGKRGDRVR